MTKHSENSGSASEQPTSWGERAIDALLIAISLGMLTPLILLVGNAFKTPAEMLAWPPTFIPSNPTGENFRAVLAETPLPRWIFNSLVFAILSTMAIVATSALAGYVFGKFRYRSVNAIFFAFLATAIVPFEVYMIPLYFQVQALGLMNTIWGVLIAYLVMSFGIFLVRQNVILNVPDD
jgi:multiple sugar transport system permease protein